MRTPVPKLIHRPSRSAPAALLALLLLALGALGIWLLGYRLITGVWPQRSVTTLQAISSASFDSTWVLIIAGVAAACGLAMLISAFLPGKFDRVAILQDDLPGQTAVSHRDLATLVKNQLEQIGDIRSATVTVHRSRIDVIAFTDLDDLSTLNEVVSQKTDEALRTFQPSGITRSRVRIKQTN